MLEPDRIIRLKTVLAGTGLSRSTIYRKIAVGTFPAQLKISANGTGWHESDINRWIADPIRGDRKASSMKSGTSRTNRTGSSYLYATPPRSRTCEPDFFLAGAACDLIRSD